MYSISRTKGFKKAVKLCIKRGLDINALNEAIEILALKGVLPPEHKPHKLKGKYSRLWECHIAPDWLLIWDQNDRELTLLFINTGSHSDLFG